MRKSIASLAIFAMALVTAPSANAHAQLSSSFPKPGAVVRVWPEKFWVEFDGNLVTLGSKSVNLLYIKDPVGKSLKITGMSVAGARLSAIAQKPQKSGTYRILWRVVSEDGHPVTNSFTFLYIPKA